MGGVLKSKVSVYEFDLDTMKALIANDLGVLPNRITVEYVIQEVGGDPMDRYPGHKQVTGVRVTLDTSALEGRGMADVTDRPLRSR